MKGLNYVLIHILYYYLFIALFDIFTLLSTYNFILFFIYMFNIRKLCCHFFWIFQYSSPFRLNFFFYLLVSIHVDIYKLAFHIWGHSLRFTGKWVFSTAQCLCSSHPLRWCSPVDSLLWNLRQAPVAFPRSQCTQENRHIQTVFPHWPTRWSFWDRVWRIWYWFCIWLSKSRPWWCSRTRSSAIGSRRCWSWDTRRWWVCTLLRCCSVCSKVCSFIWSFCLERTSTRIWSRVCVPIWMEHYCS